MTIKFPFDSSKTLLKQISVHRSEHTGATKVASYSKEIIQNSESEAPILTRSLHVNLSLNQAREPMRSAVITRRQARTAYLKSSYSFDPKKTLLKENETGSNYSTNIQLIFSLFPVMTIKVKHKSPHQREIIYLSLHCHHQNDSRIKMGSVESHFNVSAGSDGQSHRTVSTNHNLFVEKGEQKRYRTEVLPLTSLTPYR